MSAISLNNGIGPIRDRTEHEPNRERKKDTTDNSAEGADIARRARSLDERASVKVED